MKKIKLYGKYAQGKHTIVDADDFDYINRFRWYLSPQGYVVAKKRVNGNLKELRIHRLIMKPNIGEIIDHINHNKLDNRKSNLRICTQGENQANRKPKKNGTSKYKGVYWSKSNNKWLAVIIKNKKYFYLGGHDTEVDAAKAYDIKAKELFGEYAYLNIQN